MTGGNSGPSKGRSSPAVMSDVKADFLDSLYLLLKQGRTKRLGKQQRLALLCDDAICQRQYFRNKLKSDVVNKQNLTSSNLLGLGILF